MSENKTKNWQKIKEESDALDNDDRFEDDEDLTDAEDPSEHVDGALEQPSIGGLEEKLLLAEKQAHENWEKSVRAIAELDNVRRRAERDVANAHRYGQEKLIASLLPILDSLEQALQLADKDANAAMHEGLQLTMKLFLDVLDKHDVKQLDPQGEPFNPQEHEAMSMQDVPGVAPNSIVAVFQKGYKLNDRIIRPARVIVAKPRPIDENV
ncbi:nucleotide exchange factor GrpE [Legionella taurinensis]|uniref:Protein GrpE n=1 Tax=Legionella taurinensis TaxID=70611 RepID=A0A3A5L7C3_9GAMM|nr:nucleotide exchange factor GrpE [Legionella taurinensis]MDX1836400.1 nucleotide exchange factor GrpE [Legionella taurinensis]PUT43127.1 nucleotide exchange factor GrpE [Legionella taurinensis]PUT45056.1 nucleotide exchange factor GrpE [Legionella taurinensis]PUT45682.1 nucleotide exchange factor GrpE [Legionella taurinensis]PUT49451.1 nucleotide exchange factor GrpE [Legionella taurinensis]